MASDATAWVLNKLADKRLAPLAPAETRGFVATGFTVASAEEQEVARVTVTARFTGQDKYDHWDEARHLANRVMDVPGKEGAGFEEIDGREPNCVFDVYPPAARTAEQ